MPASPQVLAVCVNWNGREVLPDTLASLKASSYQDLRVIVVDNASQDSSTELVPADFELMRLKENIGYGAAFNRVLETYFEDDMRTADKETPSYFLLLNNDVVLKPDLVEKLVDFAEKTGPGVYGPKILRAERPTHLDAAFGEVTWSHVIARYRGVGRADAPSFNRVQKVTLLLGCVMLIHRQVIEQTGFFDERFFMYHEEVDFLFRVRARGLPCYYFPFTHAYHRSAHSTRNQPWQKVYWVRRNAVYFLRKHAASPVHWTRFAISSMASLLYNLLLLRWKMVAVSVRALSHGWKMNGPAR